MAPNNVARALQTDTKLLRYASAITGNKRSFGNCCLKSLTSSKLRATTGNKMQQGVQTDATCNTQQCCVRLHWALGTLRFTTATLTKTSPQNLLRLLHLIHVAHCVRSVPKLNWYKRFQSIKIKNKRFTLLVCSRCRQNLKCDDFASLLCKVTQKYVLKCVLHVQNNFCFSFNQ